MPPVKSTLSFADQNISGQSLLQQFKVKIYCGLNVPAGFYYLYHLIIFLLLLVNCFWLNLAVDFSLTDSQRRRLTAAMAFFDTVLLTIFTTEWALRLFVANCNIDSTVFSGLMSHMRQSMICRVYDFLCTLLLGLFVFSASQNTSQPPPSMRLTHFLLLFQSYRFFFSTFRHFRSVLLENLTLVLMSLSLFTIVLTVATYGVSFFEMYRNESINSLFDAAWFSFISLSTIGFGDIMIGIPSTKFLIAVCVICGFTVFTLPGSIIGSAVALRTQDSRQKLLCLRPAANLLQKTWHLYAVHHIDQYWDRFVIGRAMHQESPTVVKQLTRKDEFVVLFLCKVSFFLAMNRFRYANLVHNTGSVPLQYAQLQRKIKLVNIAVGKHNYDINMFKFQLKKLLGDLKRSKSELKRITASISLRNNLPPEEPKTDPFEVTASDRPVKTRVLEEQQ